MSCVLSIISCSIVHLILESPVVSVCRSVLTLHFSALYPFSLCLMEAQCVFCEVRCEINIYISYCVMETNFIFRNRGVAQAVICRPLPTESLFRYRAAACEICVG